MPLLSLTSISNRQYLIVSLTILGILLVYIPSLASGFFSDDFIYIVENRNIQAASMWNVLTVQTNPYEFLPLRDLTYWIDFRLFGLNPLPYKVHNLIWYVLSCIGSYYASFQIALLFSLTRDESIKFALITLGIFSFHPLHVESVAWISGRKDLISGALIFLATGLFAQGVRIGRQVFYWMAVAVFAISLMGKAAIIVFPCIALLILYAKPSKPLARLLLPIAAMCCIAYVDYLSARSTGIASNIAPTITNDDRGSVELALKIAGFAFWKSVFPVDIRLVYDELHSTVKASSPLALFSGIAVFSGAIASVWWYWRRRSLMAFSLIWFLLFLIPYLQFIPFRTWAPFSDRFAFLPSFAVGLAIATVIVRNRRTESWIAYFVLLFFFFSMSLVRSSEWRTFDILLRQNAEKSHGSYIAQSMLIDTVLIPSGQYQEAMYATERVINPQLRELLAIRVRDTQLQNTASREARAAYLKSVFSSKGSILLSADSSSLAWLSTSYLSAGLYSESEALLRSLLSRPDFQANQAVRYNLGLALAGQNRLAEARHEFELVANDSNTDAALRSIATKKIESMFGVH